MSQETWTAVDRYFSDTLVKSDLALVAVLHSGIEAGLPPINVSPNQGKLLYLLARLQKARNILEIGTLAGYSAIWMGRALPADGHLITLEFNPKHADIARSNISRAGLTQKIEVRLGPALEALPRLSDEKRGPFDLIFIDADKPSNPQYFSWALKLSRPGSLIIIDNVVRDGKVIDAKSNDAGVQGVRRMNEIIAAEPRVSATAFQTVGSKGYDGLAIVVVNENL